MIGTLAGVLGTGLGGAVIAFIPKLGKGWLSASFLFDYFRIVVLDRTISTAKPHNDRAVTSTISHPAVLIICSA